MIKSEKDKRFAEVEKVVVQLRNALKINDWINVSTHFDSLNTQIEKAKSVIAKIGVPKIYIKAILDLEKNVNEAVSNKEAVKKMNSNNAKALTSMKQKVRKNNARYTKEIEAYQANPLAEEEVKADVVAEAKAEPVVAKKPAAKKSKAKKESDSESDSESSESSGSDSDSGSDSGSDSSDSESDDSGSESDSESSSSESAKEDGDGSDSDLDKIDMSATSGAWFKREYWVKKGGDKKQTTVKKRQRRVQSQPQPDQPTSDTAPVAAAAPAPEPEMTPEMITKRLRELLASRGKRGTDRVMLITDLQYLLGKATVPVTQLKLQVTLISSLFDLATAKGTPLPAPLWKQAYNLTHGVMDSLETNALLRLSEDEEVKEAFDDLSVEDKEKRAITLSGLISGDKDKESKSTAAAAAAVVESKSSSEEDDSEVSYVLGTMQSFVQRLALELRTSLQNTDPHATEYLTRLKDEAELIRLAERTQQYYKRLGKLELETLTARLRLEFEYYHYHPHLDAGIAGDKPAAAAAAAAPLDEKDKKESNVPQLAAFLYKHGNAKARTKALLYHVYHLALHNMLSEASDLLLMSRVSDAVHEMGTNTRILFHRALAQLGLANFRQAKFKAALGCLGDLFASGRVKELIAQGISTSRNYQDRDLEREAVEKKRLYPYHMHMNLDMLEAAHLISAMFAELPLIALYGDSTRRKVASRFFKKLLDSHMRQPFNGPPENTRDLIITAAKSIRLGDWQKAVSLLSKLRMWSLMRHGESVLTAVKLRVQEEALRAYLTSFGTHYSSISLPSLADMFALPLENVQRVASKLLLSEVLQGGIDQPSQCLMVDAQEPNALQKAALAYADRVSALVEANERLVDLHRSQQRVSDRRQDFGGKGRTARGAQGQGQAQARLQRH